MSRKAPGLLAVGFVGVCSALALSSSVAFAAGTDASTSSKAKAPAEQTADRLKPVASSEWGTALAGRQAKAATVKAALAATVPDLAQYFDAPPSLRGAFEDARDRRFGGAPFTAQLKRQPVSGIVTCRIDDAGADVRVVYCRPDAPREEWAKLLAAGREAADGKDTKGDVLAAAAQVKLSEHTFNDGTGSIGLADGWKTNADTCLGPVVILGPAGQYLTIGATRSCWRWHCR